MSWEPLGAATDAHRSLLFVVVFRTGDVLIHGGGGTHGEGEERCELCGCGTDGKVEGDSLGVVSRGSTDGTRA